MSLKSDDERIKEFKSQDFSPVIPSPTAVANPAPLGLAAFGMTTLILSVYNAGAIVNYRAPHNLVVGMALFYGGLVQLLAGMWEFKAGNTFGATAFSSYGAFWLSFATILIPGSGVLDAYTSATTVQEVGANALDKALGVYLLAWALFTFIMLLCTLRQNVASILLFGMLFVTFLLLAVGVLTGIPRNSKTATQVGGYCGIITALIAMYIVLANLANKEHTYFTLPIGVIGHAESLIYE